MHRMNQQMVESALSSARQAELVLWLVEVSEAPGPGERFVREQLRRIGHPVVLAINKIDSVRKPRILPAIDAYRRLMDFQEIVPVSARTGENVDRLAELLLAHLPEGDRLYPEDFLSDQPGRLFVAEIVREQILAQTREEVPYSVGVVIDSFAETDGLLRIEASVLVERESQKGILIGRAGQRLKAIGTAARHQIEAQMGAKAYLGLFVKVQRDWREDPAILESMGLGADRGGR